MRIALVPLDSRPPNWLFPRRLADRGGPRLAPDDWRTMTAAAVARASAPIVTFPRVASPPVIEG